MSNKTPAMILQEISVKLSVALKYEELPASQEGQQKIFKIKVNCNGNEAEGIATTKKGAKQNAAGRMLTILQKMNIISDSTLKGITWECDSNNSSPNDSIASYCSDTSESLSNYIGLLNEYCQENGLPLAVYTDSLVSGTPNNPTFSVSCAVGSTCLQATGNTKKKAKQNASEKVFKALRDNPELSKLLLKKEFSVTSEDTKALVEKLGFDIECLTIANTKDVSVSEKQFIETQYTKFKGKEPIKPQIIGDRHKVIQKLVQGMSRMQRDHILLLHSKTTATNKSTIEHAICTAFKIKTIQKFILRSREKEVYIAGCRIKTDPVIVVMAMAKTVEEAELQALKKTLELLVFYLNSA